MSRSTVVTAYFVDNALLMEEASRTTMETSWDDEGAIGSRENLVHCPKQQSNNGVKQIRRRVDVDNTTKQSNNTREREKEDSGDNDDWYGGATLREGGRGGKL